MKTGYSKLGDWLESLSTIQYVLVGAFCAFVLAVVGNIVSSAGPENIISVTTTAVETAIAVAVILLIIRFFQRG